MALQTLNQGLLNSITSNKGVLAGEAGYSANAVTFSSGDNDILNRGSDLTGSADGKEGLLSLWFLTTDSGIAHVLNSTSNRVSCAFNVGGSGSFIVLLRNSSGTTIGSFVTNTDGWNDSAWHHIMISWNLATSAAHLYVDNSENLTETTNTDDTIEYTNAEWTIGGTVAGPSHNYEGDLADYLFNDAYIDLSVAGNRAKFIDASTLKPVDIGAGGIDALGETALICFQNPTSTWHTNTGDGGGFTLTGALGTASSSPSD